MTNYVIPFDKPTLPSHSLRSNFPETVFPRVMSSQLLEEALKKIPNQQLLVNVVSKRVRQLTQGHRPMVDYGPRMGFSDIALKEIIEGKLTFEVTSAETSEAV